MYQINHINCYSIVVALLLVSVTVVAAVGTHR